MKIIANRKTHSWSFLLALLFTPSILMAQSIDKVATPSIKNATTSPDYQTDWVTTLPEDKQVPSPRDVLGYTVGTPGKLTSVSEISRYFKILAKNSPRVKLFSLGKSFEGREMIVAAISDKDTIDNLETYRQYTNLLADPRKTNRKQANDIIQKAKPIYWMTAGLHSTELGPPEMVMELAYRLAVQDDDLFKRIRKNTIVLITPVLETDGRARQVQWYKSHLQQYTDYDNTPPKSPPFWGHYTFHDNNRDGLVFSQPLTQNYVKGFYHWKPTLSLDLHESVPLLYVSTGTGPYNTSVDPITITEWQSIANYEVSRLTAKGAHGVWTWGFYTGWFPGYLLWVTNNHNANGRFYETFGNHSARTMKRNLYDRKMAGKKVTDKTWYRSLPPKKKFIWSMRDNTNLMESGTIASLELVSSNPKIYLQNFYQKSVNGLTRAIKKAPFAYAIPYQQDDINAAQDLISILHQHGIEIHQLKKIFKLGKKKQLKANDFVILLNQPYGSLAKNLLEKQKFPEKVLVPPYDDIGWTLGLQMGVKVIPIDNKKILKRSLKMADYETAFQMKSERGTMRYFIIDHHAQNELGPLRFALKDSVVYASDAIFKISGKPFQPGSFIIDSKKLSPNNVRKIIAQHQLKFANIDYLPKVKKHLLDLPRVGLLHSWVSTQNAGWVRYNLDTSKIPYTLITKDLLKKGHLKDQFDVLIAPSYSGVRLSNLIGGVDKKWSPLAYKKTPQTPAFGVIASSDDITGGFGFDGMQAIDNFIRQGGTFIGLHNGGILAASSGITHKVRTSRPSGLNTPGSILTTKILKQSPLTRGYKQWTHVFRGNGPIFQVRLKDRNNVQMQFGSQNVPELDDVDKKKHKNDKKHPLVLSGAILSGKKAIDGTPALVNEKVGKGQVVLFSWNPLHRNINHHDHAFFYNALLNWNDL